MKKILNKYLPLAFGKYFNIVSIFSEKSVARKAFTLFCSPRKGKVLPPQKEFLDSAKKEVVFAEGINIQVYEFKGNKETLLLLHGWESNVFRWRNLIDFLKKTEYNIIAIDAPAHGNSSGTLLNVPLYAKVSQVIIEKYNPKYIVGHSVGGMTTLYNEYLYKNKNVEKMVILGAPSDFTRILDDYQNLLKFNNKVLEALKKYIKNNFGFEVASFSMSEYVKTNIKSGLLIHDEFDKIAPCSESEAMHKNWKNSTFVKTKGLGHSLHQDDVNQQIVDFLKTK